MAVVKSETVVMGRKGAFSSDDLPTHLSESERFERSFHGARPGFVPVCEMVQAEGRQVDANFEFACFGDAALIRFRANVNREIRAARHIATDKRDAYHLVFNTNGAPLALSQHGREAVQETGHACLTSMAETLDVHSRTDMSTVCLSISGGRLRERIANPDDLVLRVLDPANMALCHLRRYMKCLFAADEFEGDPILGARIETTLIDLAALTLGAEDDSMGLAGDCRGSSREVGTVPRAPRHGLCYRFAGFELEPCERRLTARGEPVTLTPKVFDTLVLLVERAGRVVSKDELLAALWPRGFVTDANLVKHIWAIRKALNGGACEGDSRFIETVSKAGYRFIAPVERINTAEAAIANDGVPLPALSAEPPSTTNDENPAAQPLAATPDAMNRAPLEHRMFGRRASDRELALAHAGAVRKRRRHWGLGVAAIAVLAIGGVVGGLLWQRPSPSRRRLASLTPGTSVAIVAFNNLSQNPKDAWLGPALTEMLATEVTATGKMHVLPGELVRPARTDLPAPMTGGYAPASLATLRKRLGADYVISGGYLVAGTGVDAQVRVDVVLQDARKGAGVAQFSQSQRVSNLLKIVAGAGVALRAKLGLPAVAPGNVRQLAGAQPPSPDVARHIGFALDALHAYDPARARDELLLAVAEAPAYAPAYALLSHAWLALGYHDNALAAIKQAAAHAASLPEDQRLRIQAQQYALAYDWDAAARSYATLITQHPDDPEPRLQQIEMLVQASNLEAADDALAKLRRVSKSAADPRLDLIAADIAWRRRDFDAEVQYAMSALKRAQARDAAGLVARAQWYAGRGDASGGNVAAAMHWLGLGIAGYQRMGNPHGEAAARKDLGWLYATQNDWENANEQYQRALAIHQRIGDRAGEVDTDMGIANLRWLANDIDGARSAIRDAMKISAQVGDKARRAHALATLAALRSNDTMDEQTVAWFRQAIALHEQVDDVSQFPWTLARYSIVLWVRGDVGQAQAACEHARAVASGLRAPRAMEYALAACSDTALVRGEVAEAVSLSDQLIALARKTNDQYMLEVALIQRAKLEVMNRSWAQARKYLTTVIPITTVQHGLGDEAIAQALLARCEQALGHPAARDRAMTRARELRKNIHMRVDAFQVDLPLAELSGETGDRATAVAKLRSIATDADSRYWVEAMLETRLATYRLLKQARDPAAAALHDRIESTAKAHGFKWVLARLDTPAGAELTTTPN